MEGWKTMDTAPKDGTLILIARSGDEDAEIEITKWCVSENWHYEQVEGGLYRKVMDKPYQFWNGNGHRATHWMPLPPAPESD